MKLQALTVALVATLSGSAFAMHGDGNGGGHDSGNNDDNGGSESFDSLLPDIYPPQDDLFDEAWYDGIVMNLRDIEHASETYAGWCLYMSGGRGQSSKEQQQQGQGSQENFHLAKAYYDNAMARWAWRNVKPSDFHNGKYGITCGEAMSRYNSAVSKVERACAPRYDGKQEQYPPRHQDQGQQDQGQQQQPRQDQGQQDQGQQLQNGSQDQGQQQQRRQDQGQQQQIPQEQGKYK